jgi:HK97 family phage portal protein
MAESRSLLSRILGGAGITFGGSEKALSTTPEYDDAPYARGVAGVTHHAKRSTQQLRRWSRTNPWIRAAINLRRTQVSRAKWDIVAVDSDSPVNAKKVQEIKDLLRMPNPKMESWRSLMEPVIEDILVLDQGVIEVVPTNGGRIGSANRPISALYNKDASKLVFDSGWDGSDPNQPRYYEFDHDGREIARYLNHELIVIVANPVTYTPLGLSPLEVLAETIEADLAAAAYNAKAVTAAAPPGVLHLGEGVRADQVDAFRAYWDAEIAGRSQIAITGGGKGIQWMPLASSNRDMQFMEWQVYLARKICAVFGVQPQDIGISFDVNRSTSETGAAFTQDVGIAPLLDLIAEYITREIVWRYDQDLRFAYTDMGRQSQGEMAAYYKTALAGLPWLRLNDALRERGQDGVGEQGEQIWLPSPQGYMPMDVYMKYLNNIVAGGQSGPDDNTPPTANNPQGVPTPPQGEDMTPDNTPENAPQAQTSKADGDPIIVCDIDGTLTTSDGSEEPNEAVVDYLNRKSENHRIFIVSARSAKRLEETREWLEDNDVPHDAIYLSDFPAGAGLQFKKYKISKILKENGNVTEAIENDAEVRSAYKAAGVQNVHGPEDVASKYAAADYSGINLSVPSAVKAEARRGLKWREEFGRGGIGPGQTTARMLIGNKMTIARVRKMRAFLARHEVDKQGEGFNPGEKGYPSAGRIAWALWGGNPGQGWANKIMRQVEAREKR